MLLMMHCDLRRGAENQHFQSTLLVGMEEGGGGHTKVFSVYAL